MRENSLSALVREKFQPQKNSDLLFCTDISEHLKNRYQSHVCFVDDPAPAPTDDPAPAPSSILGADPEPKDEPEEDSDSDGGDDDKKTGDEDEEGDDPEPSTGAPEKYELTMPEGMELDQETFEKFEPLFRKANLSNEMASELAGAYGEQISSLVQLASETAMSQLQQSWVDLNSEWQESLMKDPEYGGAKAHENFNVAKSVIDRFGGDDSGKIREALNVTGAGNNPEIMRLLYRVGRAMADDKLGFQGSPGGKGKVDLYPNSDMND